MLLQDNINKLQRRVEAVDAAIARAERDGQLFTKVLRAADKNLPNDPSHMARIDKVHMFLYNVFTFAFSAYLYVGICPTSNGLSCFS